MLQIRSGVNNKASQQTMWAGSKKTLSCWCYMRHWHWLFTLLLYSDDEILYMYIRTAYQLWELRKSPYQPTRISHNINIYTVYIYIYTNISNIVFFHGLQRPVSCSQVSEDAVDFVKSLGIFQFKKWRRDTGDTVGWVVGGISLGGASESPTNHPCRDYFRVGTGGSNDFWGVWWCHVGENQEEVLLAFVLGNGNLK